MIEVYVISLDYFSARAGSSISIYLVQNSLDWKIEPSLFLSKIGPAADGIHQQIYINCWPRIDHVLSFASNYDNRALAPLKMQSLILDEAIGRSCFS